MPPPMLSIKLIRRSDGVLHPVAVRRGVPLVLPNLWIDDLALTARFNTLRAYSGDVLILYRYAEASGVNLYEAFSGLNGLSPGTLKRLVASMTILRDGRRASASSCSRKAKALRSFVAFCFDYFISKRQLSLLEQRQAERNRDAQLARIEKLFSMRAQQGEATGGSTSLLEDQVAIIDQVLQPAFAGNPFKDECLRLRNYCIWRTMLSTGARRAELVLLELQDLEFGSKPTITIRRPSAAAANRRRDGASLKTESRILPIPLEVAVLLETYVEDWRSRHIRRRHPSPALFLSAKDGRRLSASTINQICKAAVDVAASRGLSLRMHPHGIRTTAMNALMRAARDDSGRLPPDFRDQLTYYAGWSPRSDMPLTYTREALSEALGKLLRNPRPAKQ